MTTVLEEVRVGDNVELLGLSFSLISRFQLAACFDNRQVMPQSQNTKSHAHWSLVTDGPVLAHLPPEAVELFLQHGRRKSWQRGQAVVRRGDRVHAVMIVMEGSLRASTLTNEGEENLLGWLKDYELFGVPNVLGGMAFAVDIIADSPAVTLHVAREDFLDVLRDVPAAAIGVAIALSHRVGLMFSIINASGHRSLTARVRAQLLHFAEQYGQRSSCGQTVLDVAQNDLAAAVGASRQRVHMELRKLEDSGFLKLGYRRIILLPPPADS